MPIPLGKGRRERPGRAKEQAFCRRGLAGQSVFDFLLKAYQTTVGFADRMVMEAEGLDEHTRTKALFYMRR